MPIWKHFSSGLIRLCRSVTHLFFLFWIFPKFLFYRVPFHWMVCRIFERKSKQFLTFQMTTTTRMMNHHFRHRQRPQRRPERSFDHLTVFWSEDQHPNTCSGRKCPSTQFPGYRIPFAITVSQFSLSLFPSISFLSKCLIFVKFSDLISSG